MGFLDGAAILILARSTAVLRCRRWEARSGGRIPKALSSSFVLRGTDALRKMRIAINGQCNHKPATPVRMVSSSALVWWMIGACFALAAAPATDLEWETSPGFRYTKIAAPSPGKAGLMSVPPSHSGVLFTNRLAEQRHLTNQILLNGSGVAAGDVDGDGWCDLYFCALDGPNALYRNLGNWKFEEIAARAGVSCAGLDCTGAALFDFDGDGDLDLIVNSVGGGTHIFMNDGQGRFRQATPPSGLNPGRGGTSLAIGDVNGDGYLDFYVANYRTVALMDQPETRFWLRNVNGRQVVAKVNDRPATEPDLVGRFRVNERGGIEENGEPDVLYFNVGGTNVASASFLGGAFQDEEGKALTEIPLDWALSAMFRDINGDGLPDLYVCNDFDSPDRLWINQNGERFRAAPHLALRKTSLFSMAIDFADINRDGFDDFIVVDMLSRDHRQRMDTEEARDTSTPGIGDMTSRPQYMVNTLFLNRGDGIYAEIGYLSGLAASDWSWAAVFLDVDLNGYEDVLISNGNERASRSRDIAEELRRMRKDRKMSPHEILQARKIYPRHATPNLAFRNNGDLTFTEAGNEWGFDFNGVSHGIALADLDNDGDLDVIVNNLNAAASIYRNNGSAPRVAIRLKGKQPNTRGIGARVKVIAEGMPDQSQEMMAGGRYLSCDDAIRTFATGPAAELRIEVDWPGGARSVVESARPNCVYEIDEAAAPSRPKPGSKPPPALFRDVSLLLNHSHHEEAFDDLGRQPLLPRRFSQPGPGVTWTDFDGDGWEDLLIGSGKGGRLALYRNDGQGGFTRWHKPPFDQPVTRDQTTLLPCDIEPGEKVILAGSSNYEDGLAVGSCVRHYDPRRNLVQDSLPSAESSAGPLAMADIDGDGDLDLFVGGRIVPGRYPQAASSLVFRNNNGNFERDPDNCQRLEGVGLVNGAVFSDLDGDGDSDLVLACDWGPIRIFRNDAGALNEATARYGLDGYRGWWNGVATGDFDGDGRMDIVASNWGRNTPGELSRSKTLKVFFGDFDENGTWDLIEAYHDHRQNKLVPRLDLEQLGRAMPFVQERFQSHQAYGRASVSEILGNKFGASQSLEANWPESTLFLNRGTGFVARPLPVEAQIAPAWGLAVGDFDGDGAEDLFLSQNFFPFRPGVPRCDAGRGLLLRGDGKGGFWPLDGERSGIKLYGEQRGCAVADFNGDGRLDLAVGQNGAQTFLFQNSAGKPGLRVRLRGPAGNPNGIGAQIRIGAGQSWNPVRELRSGGGYWSCDGAVQVLPLAANRGPVELWVRWPGGRVTTVQVPAEAREIAVNSSGELKRIQ